MAFQDDLHYTKTGEGTSSVAVGFENGPFQPWQTGGTYESLYDQALGEIWTDVMPQVVLGGFYEHIANGNVVTFPWGEVYQPTEFDDSYDITRPLDLTARKGSIRTCSVDHVIKIGIIFQNFELRTSGSARLASEYRMAVEGQARKFEMLGFNDLIKGGLDSNKQIAWLNEGTTEAPVWKVDIFNTFLNIRKLLSKRGLFKEMVDVYVTPDLINMFMNDKHFISTFGNSPQAGEEVRFGWQGNYLGFNIYESGMLSWMHDEESGAITMPTKADLIFVARSRITLCRFPVQPIMIQAAPSDRIDCSILSGLEYFKHFVHNDYAVRYADIANATHN